VVGIISTSHRLYIPSPTPDDASSCLNHTVAHVHARKAYKESRGMASLNLKLDPRWQSVVKSSGIGHILRRNFLIKEVTEGKIKEEIEVTRRRGRRRKKLLDDLKDRRGYSYLKEEALDRTMWSNRFGRGVGPVVRLLNE
jgi:hypothetical protein